MATREVKWTAAVGAVIFDARERVLLVRRARPPMRGAWTLPGGRVEEGESLTEAVAREVREETGLDIDVRAPIEVVRVAREGYRYEIHEYLCEVRAIGARCPSPALAGDDALELAWVAPSDLRAKGVKDDARRVVTRGLTLLRSC